MQLQNRQILNLQKELINQNINLICFAKNKRQLWQYERGERWFEIMWSRRHDPLYQNMWISDFRMSAGTFEALVEKVKVALEKRDTHFRKAF